MSKICGFFTCILGEGSEKNAVQSSIQSGSASILVSYFLVNDQLTMYNQMYIW